MKISEVSHKNLTTKPAVRWDRMQHDEYTDREINQRLALLDIFFDIPTVPHHILRAFSKNPYSLDCGLIMDLNMVRQLQRDCIASLLL